MELRLLTLQAPTSLPFRTIRPEEPNHTTCLPSARRDDGRPGPFEFKLDQKNQIPILIELSEKVNPLVINGGGSISTRQTRRVQLARSSLPLEIGLRFSPSRLSVGSTTSVRQRCDCKVSRRTRFTKSKGFVSGQVQADGSLVKVGMARRLPE